MRALSCKCQVKPEERLGYDGADGIRAHPWFNGLDWAALEARTVPAPITPSLASPFDTANFDEFIDPPPAPRFSPGQADPNAAAWADLWEWVGPQPGATAAAPLSRRASGTGPGLAALRAASLTLRTSIAAEQQPSAVPSVAGSVVQQAQERLAAMQLQQADRTTEPVDSSTAGACAAANGKLHVSSSGLHGEPGGLDFEQPHPAASQQPDRSVSSGPGAEPVRAIQASAFAAVSTGAAMSGGDPWGSDSSSGSPVRASLPSIAVSLTAVSAPVGGCTDADVAGLQPADANIPRGGSVPSPTRPAAVGIPTDLPVYAASADGLVSPLASAGRIDLSGEMSEKGHFVITAGGLVNPAANAGKIVLELDATDTDKFMALDSGIVSPTASSGRIILLPEEPAKGSAEQL